MIMNQTDRKIYTYTGYVGKDNYTEQKDYFIRNFNHMYKRHGSLNCKTTARIQSLLKIYICNCKTFLYLRQTIFTVKLTNLIQEKI